jgi:hypothetical protein
MNGHSDRRLRPPTRAVSRPLMAETRPHPHRLTCAALAALAALAAINGRRTGGWGLKAPRDRSPAMNGRVSVLRPFMAETAPSPGLSRPRRMHHALTLRTG